MELLVYSHIIIVAALIIASIVDIKKREVPDILSYTLIAIGILFGILMTINTNDFTAIFRSLIGLGVGAGIGTLLYYSGQWGGGDAKAFMGIGAILGVGLTGYITGDLFINFFVNILWVGAAYGFIWILVIGFKHRKKVLEKYEEIRKESILRHNLHLVIAFVVLFIILLALPIMETLKIVLIAMLCIFYLLMYFIVFVKSVEGSCMVKKIPVSKLTEGDWLLEEIKIGRKTIKKEGTGVSMKEIEILRKSKIRKVKIKEGIPFVPSFLLAYLITLLTGPWLLILF